MFSGRRRSGLGRGFALALASCVVGAQLSSFAHLLLVKHALCPEHGELIHADERARVDTRGEPALSTAVVARESSAAAALDHAHCPLAVQRRERVALMAPAALVSPRPATLEAVLCSRPLPSVPQCELFRLAPKGSPPAA
jgi:hypothetical protein